MIYYTHTHTYIHTFSNVSVDIREKSSKLLASHLRVFLFFHYFNMKNVFEHVQLLRVLFSHSSLKCSIENDKHALKVVFGWMDGLIDCLMVSHLHS